MPRGLIKASYHYNTLAAREDWLKFCAEYDVDPNSIDWRTMSHKKIDKHIARLRTTTEQPREENGRQ